MLLGSNAVCKNKDTSQRAEEEKTKNYQTKEKGRVINDSRRFINIKVKSNVKLQIQLSALVNKKEELKKLAEKNEEQ